MPTGFQKADKRMVLNVVKGSKVMAHSKNSNKTYNYYVSDNVLKYFVGQLPDEFITIMVGL